MLNAVYNAKQIDGEEGSHILHVKTGDAPSRATDAGIVKHDV